MFEWITAIAALSISIMGLTIIVPRMMAKRPKGGSGIIVGFMMVLSSVFDPAQSAAVVQLDRNKETKGSEEGEGGDRPV
jgi:hypothetical protein